MDSATTIDNSADLDVEQRHGPDRAALSAFANTVFGCLSGYAGVRMLGEKGGDVVRPDTPFEAITADLDKRLLAHALAAEAKGAGLFVVPGAIDRPGSARAADVSQMSVLLVDLDDGNVDAKVEFLERHLGGATLEVESGGVATSGQLKRHLYWRLTDVANRGDLELLAEVRLMMAQRAGGDPAFRSLHQPIRIPGSVYCKGGARRPVRIRRQAETSISLFAAAEAVRDMPIFSCTRGPTGSDGRAREMSARQPTAQSLMQKTVRAGGVDGITRFDAIGKVIGHWVRLIRLGQTTREEAWKALVDYNAACLSPPFDERRLRHDFERIEKRDVVQHAASNDVSPGRINEGPPPPELSDDDLARRFTAAHGDDWRYVAQWGRWLFWDGNVWRHDETGRVHQLIRLTCRVAALDAEPKQKQRVTARSTIVATEQIARSDDIHATSAGVWDQEAMKLNTPGGILDLQTGQIELHSPRALMTRIANAEPGGDCPLWTSFLDDVTNGDPELKGYLARVAGYCLTGSTCEHVLFFLFGSGANGKSVFLDVISDVLGDYARSAPLDTFLAGKGEKHPTDLAALRGLRLVTVTETDPNRGWALGRQKAFTAGDPIQARFMRQDFFEYRPTGKVLIAGNHKPSLGSVDEAIRRRIHLVPFAHVVPPDRRDRGLRDRLLAERSGIMSWMLDGLADWRERGLDPPHVVRAATAEYFDEEDLVGQWIAESCEVHRANAEPSAQLFNSWKSWSEGRGEASRTAKWLSGELTKRGFKSARMGPKGARAYSGLRLRRASGLASRDRAA